MQPKLLQKQLPYLLFVSLILLYLYSFALRPYSPDSNSHLSSPVPSCNLFNGSWVQRPTSPRPLYDESCPFHRNAWNCIRNQRHDMDLINSWKWAPQGCELPRIDPERFLSFMRNKRIGFIGDSLNENFLVAFLCTLREADSGARKWKKKGAWRGAYFPKFNVVVAYHRSVLLAKYNQKDMQLTNEGVKGTHRVDVDVPADEWVNVTDFYDVLILNTGHWWSYAKFPEEAPLVFYRNGQPIYPPLGLFDGLKIVLENMVSYIEKEVPKKTLKFWRLQSPRHFYGGEWNQNGSCLFNEPLKENELDLWFDPRNNGVNKEARQINLFIEDTLKGSDIELLDLTHLSEFRADAHPAIWLGKKGAVEIWGQDCMHWCLPGVPDTWVDILSKLISDKLEAAAAR
ncbi:Protein trichome birefringence-like 12 [Linum grandiflorum]